MFRKFLLLTLFATLLFGCAPAITPQPAPAAGSTQPAPVQTEAPAAAPTPAGIVLTDGLGREVKLTSPAQKIVSLAPSNTEILFAVGAGSQVVGRDELSDYPEAAKSVTSIGSTFKDLNTEQIISLHPDLVLAAEVNTPEQVKALEGLGLTGYYLKNPTTRDEMYGNMEIAAQLTGHAAEAAAAIESLKARVAAVNAKAAAAATRPTVFYELDATDPAKPYTAGKGTFITTLLEAAGGQNIAAQIDGYPQMSLEQVVADNPAFIILGDAAYGITPESVAARPGWGNLNAVKSKQVLPFDDNLLSRPGPRLVDGLEALAKLLHPELFK
ncbi:MAG: cobalamin-binding protein [Chloroflexi bacterium]|nr:cobalamin-binding protein [Chloroflexota bacterium]